MAISNYSELQTAIANWIDRDDLTDRIKEFIALGEARIYRDLKIEAMNKGDTIAIASNGSIALPSDYIHLRNATVLLSGGEGQALEYVTFDTLARKFPSSDTGIPLYIARSTSGLTVGPLPDGTYNVTLRYYARLPALSDSNTTNWFTDNAPDILLWASLVESTAYTQDDERLPVWESKYQQVKFEIQKEDNKARRSSAPVRSISM